MARKGTVVAGVLAVVAAVAVAQRPEPMPNPPATGAMQVLPVAVAPLTSTTRPNVTGLVDLQPQALGVGSAAPITEVRPAPITPLVLPSVAANKTPSLASQTPTRVVTLPAKEPTPAIERVIPVPKNGDVPPVARTAAVADVRPTPERQLPKVTPVASAIASDRRRAIETSRTLRSIAPVAAKARSYTVASINAPRPRGAPSPRLAPNARLQ